MNNKLKIAVYAISKNEEAFVRRFCESATGADAIIIADTGSTDSTVSLARECGATVHEIFISPWRFDKARDAALALVPRDIDVCISLDLDEILQPGWREEIERVWEPGKTTRLRYGYDWGQGIRFQYEKIHARKGYHWHHPCHEYPRPDGRIEEVYVETSTLLVSHHPDPTKSRGQYLDLLSLSVKEDPSCPRNAFYYARELTFWNRWEEAITALKTYLELPRADWVNERCYAMRLLGKAYEKTNRRWEALQWYRRATAEAPGTREPWCDLALSCYSHGAWAECYAAASRALEITNREHVYTCDPVVWGSLPHDLASIAAWNLGMLADALSHGRAAVQLNPGDERLARNVKFMENALNDLNTSNKGAEA